MNSMAIPTEPEPAPRWQPVARRSPLPDGPTVALPRSIRTPAVDFVDVLNDRMSSVGVALTANDLSSLLWHSTFLRARRPGRFGIPWESRSAPSAGGLPPIRLLVLPIEDGAPSGLFDVGEHALVSIGTVALDANRESIRNILGEVGGTTIQMAADQALLEGCYEHSNSLMWRDAGALIATICLVATALGLVATAVGRVGDTIVRKSGMPDAFVGVGAVHVGAKSD
jgi:hypothetical protein